MDEEDAVVVMVGLLIDESNSVRARAMRSFTLPFDWASLSGA